MQFNIEVPDESVELIVDALVGQSGQIPQADEDGVVTPFTLEEKMAIAKANVIAYIQGVVRSHQVAVAQQEALAKVPDEPLAIT